MTTKEMLCPKCHGQMELSLDSRFFECPLCGHREMIEDSDDVSKERIRSDAYKDVALGKKQLDNDAKKLEHQFELEKKKLDIRSSTTVFRCILIVLAVCIVIAVVGFGVFKYLHRGQIQTKMNPSEYIGDNYKVVEAELRNAGFSNISFNETDDLGMGDSDRFESVSQVSIMGEISFKKNEWFDKDAPVIIFYHDLDPERKDDIQMPDNSSSYVGLNYQVVAEKIRAAGIVNVQLQAIYDVGLFSKVDDGAVDKVLIDGDKSFRSGEWVSKNKIVKIYYHAKKSQENANDQLKDVSENDIILKHTQKEFKGQNYNDIVSLLENEGFSNITTQPLEDLKNEILHKDGEVKTVSIGGNDKFNSGSVFSKDIEIVITYHSLIPPEPTPSIEANVIVLSHSEKDLKGENFEDVLEMLKNEGFSDIIAKPLEDLKESKIDDVKVIGKLKNKLTGEDGAVKTVTINGETGFKSGDTFPTDSEVIVEYHSHANP